MASTLSLSYPAWILCRRKCLAPDEIRRIEAGKAGRKEQICIDFTGDS
jgi:hypothetical protein